MVRLAWLFWLGGLVVLLLLLDLLSGILLPFVAGCAIAYFLDPAVDWFERRHVPRGAGSGLVLLVFFLAIALVAALLLPLLQLEVAELARRAPDAVAFGRSEIEALLATAQQSLPPEELAKLRDLAGAQVASVLGWAAQMLERLFSGGLALANILSLVLVTPVVSFFLLRDWDRMIADIDRWLPRRHAETIREQVRRIDATLAGFVHGQVLVGVADAIFYGIAFTLLGLDFAVILGILIGILSFVPFVGILTGVLLGVGLALVKFGMGSRLVAVLAVFAVGYFLESNVLSPRIVGGRVNLHPVWTIFAILAFGSVFGLLGVLIAVPAAAVVGVLVRFALARYLASPLYDPGPKP
ncbi:MAG TPA: AI-2E family transporter [Stellaceae bacterium]|nr:AI-2E family transporter [Stellaceae bacterium]